MFVFMVTSEGLGFPHGNKPPGRIRESQKEKGKYFCCPTLDRKDSRKEEPESDSENLPNIEV